MTAAFENPAGILGTPGGSLDLTPATAVEAVTRHLLRLGIADRRHRFCGHVQDDTIRRYALTSARPGTVRVGFHENGILRGLGELHVDGARLFPARAELALSVEGPWQGRGIGRTLLACLLSLARNRYVGSAEILFTDDNLRVRALARAFRFRQVARLGEVHSSLAVPWPDGWSVACELVLASNSLRPARRPSRRAAISETGPSSLLRG